MVFGGFQKLTLLDFPGKVACTLFTKGCNFRCPFCHNVPLVTDISQSEEYTEEEVLSFLKKRSGVLEGVCITGGEPLMQNGIEDFIKKVKDMGYAVKLDTNGSFPQKLKALAEQKLIDYVAMDIKNSPQKYAVTSGVTQDIVSPVYESIEFLLSGKVDYEFRTTVALELHTPEDIQDIGVMIKGAAKYYIQNFEDSGNIIGENLHPVPENILKIMQKKASEYVQMACLRGL